MRREVGLSGGRLLPTPPHPVASPHADAPNVAHTSGGLGNHAGQSLAMHGLSDAFSPLGQREMASIVGARRSLADASQWSSTNSANSILGGITYGHVPHSFVRLRSQFRPNAVQLVGRPGWRLVRSGWHRLWALRIEDAARRATSVCDAHSGRTDARRHTDAVVMDRASRGRGRGFIWSRVGGVCVKIALLGFGTVGQGVVELLNRNREDIERKADTSFEIGHVVVRNLEKVRRVRPGVALTTDPAEGVGRPAGGDRDRINGGAGASPHPDGTGAPAGEKRRHGQ
jgi:hypothetical protein